MKSEGDEVFMTGKIRAKVSPKKHKRAKNQKWFEISNIEDTKKID